MDEGGSFGNQSANEYCLTLSNANVTTSVGFNSRYVCSYMHVHFYVVYMTYTNIMAVKMCKANQKWRVS